jgi:hypothetical protein
VAFPTGGTLPHAALLLVSELVYQFRPEDDPDPIPWVSVREVLDELVTEHGRYWSKGALADRDRFAADVLAQLVSVRLVEVAHDGAVRVLPPAARYAPEVTVADDDAEDEQPTLL